MKSGCALSGIGVSEFFLTADSALMNGNLEDNNEEPRDPQSPPLILQMNLEYLTVLVLGALNAARMIFLQGLFHAIPNASLHFMAKDPFMYIWYSFISSPDFLNIPSTTNYHQAIFVCCP